MSDMGSEDVAALETALRYDEAAVAAELAAWCGGELGHSQTVPDAPPVVWVPTRQGPAPASFGDWIVRRVSGDFYPCAAEDFAATHEQVR